MDYSFWKWWRSLHTTYQCAEFIYQHFDNKAINQGGALVLSPVNSDNNNLDIAHCRFVGSRVLGYALSSQKENS